MKVNFFFLAREYGGPQVHSEFQISLPVLNLTPNSWTSLWIFEPYSQFLNLNPNFKYSLRILKFHPEF